MNDDDLAPCGEPDDDEREVRRTVAQRLGLAALLGAGRRALATQRVFAAEKHRNGEKGLKAPAPAPPCGRNHACPCGSGKKWKKCCRLPRPVSVVADRVIARDQDGRVLADVAGPIQVTATPNP